MGNRRALIVQADKTMLLDTHSPYFDEIRKKIILFSELIKTPEHIHFYRITPISLWNAAANGVGLDKILAILACYKKYDIPKNVNDYVKRHFDSYGKVVIEKYNDNTLLLRVDDKKLMAKVEQYISKFVERQEENKFYIPQEFRGQLKAILIKHLIPTRDIAGFDRGNSIEFDLRNTTITKCSFALRYYQSEAIYNFSKWKEGSGVIVLPCGAGKTVVGIGIMQDIQEYTLIVATSIDSVKQWKRELLDKTTLNENDIGEYTGEMKNIRPITITTYNMLIYRSDGNSEFKHMDIFSRQNWGLIVYDEVHMLPAPIFRMTTAIQSKRRLGLTATLVREDNLESEVFTLIGPKIFEYSWKVLEQEGWIAEAFCFEIRVSMTAELFKEYKSSNNRTKFRLASENHNKEIVIEKLLNKHKNNHILVIGHYLSQLERIAKKFKTCLITGATPSQERSHIFDDFRKGKIKVLVISRVGNFSIDLPDADVAIQVSGIFGSRQEEAQRLGRILRPSVGKSYFYTLVSRNSVEETFARKRQLFLLEQGYKYTIIDTLDMIAPIKDGFFDMTNISRQYV